MQIRVLLLEHAAFLALLDEQPQLVGRVDVLVGVDRLLAERRAARAVDDSLEHVRERRHEPGERHQRRREPAREPLRVIERRAARHQLAEHDVQVRDDRQRDRRADRHAERELDRERQEREQRRERPRRAPLSATHPRREARERHAELARREKPRQIAGGAQRHPCLTVA